MKKTIVTTLLLLCALTVGAQNKVAVSSPDGKLRFTLTVTDAGIVYDVTYKKKPVVNASPLGFEFDSGEFGAGVSVGRLRSRTIDETYGLVIGKVAVARNHCRETVIPLVEKSAPGRRIDLAVRVFDDGVAFRYEFPEQLGWDSYIMYDERSGFRMAGDPLTLYMNLPGYINTHENVYNRDSYGTIAEGRLIEMPVTMEYPGEGLFVSITEAAILDYAGMYLTKNGDMFEGKLSPKPGQERIKVEIEAFPHRTPWRVISVSDTMEAIMESNILTSLNEPCRIEDTSWIEPCSTTFTWWNGNVVPDTDFSPGNNFRTNQYYIDFAARNGIDLHGIYGYAETPWYHDDNFNFGWAGPNADVTRPIPPLEWDRLAEYARRSGVGLHLWVHWRPLYDKLEEAFAKYHEWGVRGLMIDFMDRDDQEMIRIQEEFLRMAAKYELFVQFHGSSKPSGLHRTWPNEFTREGTLNYEVYKWDTTISADHDISIPFARALAGPADYHLGGFRAVPRSEFEKRYINPLVTSTRCHMLAMYVVLENHLTSLCDNPMAYEGQPGFDFLRSVPADWDDIDVTHARINEYAAIARRSGDDWWWGAINNSTARELSLPLGFLGEGVWRADIYTDAPDAAANPNNLVMRRVEVTSAEALTLALAAEGGAVIRFTKSR